MEKDIVKVTTNVTYSVKQTGEYKETTKEVENDGISNIRETATR